MNTNVTCTSCWPEQNDWDGKKTTCSGITLETPIADLVTLTELGGYVGE
jgi:hypothetical protein